VIVDASALIAIALREPGHEIVVAKLTAAGEAGIGAPTLSPSSPTNRSYASETTSGAPTSRWPD